MNAIVHDFPIAATPARVFEMVSSPAGLDEWWTLTSRGLAAMGATYDLGFGPGFDWRATVQRCVPGEAFELLMEESDADWAGTRVGFALAPAGNGTHLRFYHTGWPEPNGHYRTSCYCWAMYLRILRRNIEHGERVPYHQRLDV